MPRSLTIMLMLVMTVMLSACVGSYYTASHAGEDAQAYMQQGLRQYNAGDYAAAEQSFGRAYSLMRKARSDCVTGADCYITDDAQIKYFIAYSLSMRAICRLQLNKLGAAESDASLALEYDASEPLVNYAMALVHLAYGEYDKAREYRDRLAAMSRSSAYSADARSDATRYTHALDEALSGR